VSIGLGRPQRHRTEAADPADVDDVLAALTLDRALSHVPERPQQLGVEGQAAVEVADDQVEMVDRLHGAGQTTFLLIPTVFM
jgi:hypothetical protein